MPTTPTSMTPAASRTTRLRRAGPLAAVLAAVALSAAACGGTSPSPGVAQGGTPTPSASQSQQQGSGGSQVSGNGPGSGLSVAFSACMRSHGIKNFPDPGPNGAISISGGNGVDPNSPQFQTAQRACQKLAPGGGSPAQQAQSKAKAVRYSACMRTHGIKNFPDPNSSGAITVTGGSGVDPNSPQFVAANKICSPIMGNTSGPTQGNGS